MRFIPHCIVSVGMIAMASAAHAAHAAPVAVVKLPVDAAFAPTQILHKSGAHALVRTAAAIDSDFTDLYVLEAGHMFALPESVSQYGEVFDFVPGQFAVMRVGPDQIEDLSAEMHRQGSACGALLKLNGEATVDKIATPVPVIPVTIHDARVERLVAFVQASNIRSTVEELANIHSRYHTSASGLSVADLLVEKYEALRQGRSDVTISTYDHGTATPQNSLVVRIEGQSRPDEVIVLGSHIDSVNARGGANGRSPGADDNASGTATNLEVFRVLMTEGIRLDRTLEIHGYAAEEVGLVGSGDMARNYRNDGVKVVAMVQHDMTIWKPSGAEDKIHFVTSNTDAGFNDLLAVLVDDYVGIPWKKAALYGGSSDHASWRRNGFAAAFPFENPSNYNHHIHTANDTIANSGAFDQAAGFARLGLAYVGHFGGLN